VHAQAEGGRTLWTHDDRLTKKLPLSLSSLACQKKKKCQKTEKIKQEKKVCTFEKRARGVIEIAADENEPELVDEKTKRMDEAHSGEKEKQRLSL